MTTTQERPIAPAPSRTPKAPVVRLLSVVFLFVPLALLILGLHAKPIENRPLAPGPHWRLSWSVLPELSDYLTDRLPFRDRAVRLNAQVSQDVFNEAPSTTGGDKSALGGVVAPQQTKPQAPTSGEAPPPVPKQEQGFITLPSAAPEPAQESSAAVLVGKQGWLYLSGELYKECVRGQPPTTVISGLTRLQKILTSSGRQFIFTLAPDKSTAEPSTLPSTYPYKSCVAKSKAQTYSLLNNAKIPGYVDMRGLIATHEAAEKRPYYMRKDTHWNGLADALFAQQMASLLSPGLSAGTSAKEHVTDYTGDLTNLLGDPMQDKTLTADIVRTGVTQTSQNQVSLTSGITGLRTQSSSTRATLLAGRSLLVGDSFSEAVQPAVAPYFADLLRVKNGDFARAPRTLLTQVEQSKRVVLVFNERYFTDQHYGVFWSAPFLDKLAAALHTSG